MSRSKLLDFGAVERAVRAAASLGVRTVRLTGGEPLLRPNLHLLAGRLAAIPGIETLALTTNGVRLASQAKLLWQAGLSRLNIHLDTIDRDRFRLITRRDELPAVLDGIAQAQKVGFSSIKINAVSRRGFSERDELALLYWGRQNRIPVRFIEFMPLDSQDMWTDVAVRTAADILQDIQSEFGPVTAVADADPQAPATEYVMADGYRFGVIASVSRPFCGNCNRLRLTADGKLRNCLFSQEETDLRPFLVGDESESELKTAIRRCIWQKRAGHGIHEAGFQVPSRPMYSIGG